MFWYNLTLVDVQDFLEGYQNATNKGDSLKNYATEENKKPSIIDQIEASIVSVLSKDGIGYRGGAGVGKGKFTSSTPREH